MSTFRTVPIQKEDDPTQFLPKRFRLTYPTSQKTVLATHLEHLVDAWLQQSCRKMEIPDCISCSGITNDSRTVSEAGTISLQFFCHMSDLFSCLLSFWSSNPCILVQQMDTSHMVVYGILGLQLVRRCQT